MDEGFNKEDKIKKMSRKCLVCKEKFAPITRSDYFCSIDCKNYHEKEKKTKRQMKKANSLELCLSSQKHRDVTYFRNKADFELIVGLLFKLNIIDSMYEVLLERKINFDEADLESNWGEYVKWKNLRRSKQENALKK